MTMTKSLQDTEQKQAVLANEPASDLELLVSQSEAPIPTHVPLPKQPDYLRNLFPGGTVLVAHKHFAAGQLAPTNLAPAESPRGTTLAIDAWPVEIDLGQIPVAEDDAVRSYLTHLPAQAVRTVMRVLKSWVADTSHRVVKVDVSPFADPEDPDWLEVVFTLSVDGDPADAVRLWDDLAKTLDEAAAQLDAASKEAISSSLAFHVVPRDEE